jgi:murein DD-endopeptidase MepM/ murein hydrolase activator NlpD
VALLVAPFLYWGGVQLDHRTLRGLSVAGQRLPRTREARAALATRARAWEAQQVSILTGPHLTRATRAELGAKLEVDPIARQVAALGHSGNPLLDLWVIWGAATNGRDVPWSPHVDRARLGNYMRAIRNIVERPPVAGATDQAGWSIAGVPGLTLDTLDAADAVERALRTSETRLSMVLRRVPPPQALAIGSPDAVIYDENEEHAADETHGTGGGISTAYAAQLLAAQPKLWLPTQGCEPMDPPYTRFCQGPRKVAAPVGAAAELAEHLELGSVAAVGRLLNFGPRADWVQAAGGPIARHREMQWPVPSGALWRRFGFVRRPPFESLLHRGIDVGAPQGTPILAVNDGIVAYSDNGVRGYGNLLVVVHDDGSVTFSAHCHAIYVFAGQRVRRGQVVGEVGETGLARGTHVHWEYHVFGKPEDPNGMFQGG